MYNIFVYYPTDKILVSTFHFENNLKILVIIYLLAETEKRRYKILFARSYRTYYARFVLSFEIIISAERNNNLTAGRVAALWSPVDAAAAVRRHRQVARRKRRTMAADAAPIVRAVDRLSNRPRPRDDDRHSETAHGDSVFAEFVSFGIFFFICL